MIDPKTKSRYVATLWVSVASAWSLGGYLAFVIADASGLYGFGAKWFATLIGGTVGHLLILMLARPFVRRRFGPPSPRAQAIQKEALRFAGITCAMASPLVVGGLLTIWLGDNGIAMAVLGVLFLAWSVFLITWFWRVARPWSRRIRDSAKTDESL